MYIPPKSPFKKRTQKFHVVINVVAADNQIPKRTRLVGAIAIALVVFLFLLWFFRILSFLEWIILVVVVWLIANYVLRRLKRQQQPW